MGDWPEKVGSVIQELLDDLKARDSISGVCLFGSWSRGEAVSSSDIDLLIVDSRNLGYEYVERAEIDGFFIDLDFVPERWVLRENPPEIDQKLFEAEILFDRKAKLAKVKELILNTYRKPERIDLRTMDYLTEADIYLSRGFSSYNKGDLKSAKVSAAAALDATMKILIELNRLPISNSRFVKHVKSSAERFEASKLLEDYLRISSLTQAEEQGCERILSSLTDVWKAASGFVHSNSSTVKTLHHKVMNSLNYYCRESFWKGFFNRAQSLIEDAYFEEAAHYMISSSLHMLENFAWLVSVIENRRFDFTTLFRFLEDSVASPSIIYKGAVEAFGVEDVREAYVEEALRRVKEIIIGIRQKRREMITVLFS
ncbi:MAG: nucleotidyltransferase domain-containing protein [Nitrososphaerota archaeon]|nr:nucleotidyltransferase domain-containing protein [Candidatus Bathyarchaeota archaeon]MDW8048078.1 nucleotidyltransferase domain-containing protein [Nitrososphaerota archaeon]